MNTRFYRKGLAFMERIADKLGVKDKDSWFENYNIAFNSNYITNTGGIAFKLGNDEVLNALWLGSMFKVIDNVDSYYGRGKGKLMFFTANKTRKGLYTTSVARGVDSPIDGFLDYLESMLKYGSVKIVALPIYDSFYSKFSRKEFYNIFTYLVELGYDFLLDVLMAKIPFGVSTYAQLSMSIGQIFTEVFLDAPENSDKYYLSESDYKIVLGVALLLRGIFMALRKYQSDIAKFKTPTEKFSLRLVLSNGEEPNVYLSPKNYMKIDIVVENYFHAIAPMLKNGVGVLDYKLVEI